MSLLLVLSLPSMVAGLIMVVVNTRDTWLGGRAWTQATAEQPTTTEVSPAQELGVRGFV